jgi:lipoprotein NlpD
MVVLLLALGACSAPHRPAPVVDRYNPSEKPPPYYIVSRGDTLFSIAWRYGFDVKRLANANNIRSPYTIFPGQAIMLKERYIAPARSPKIAVKSPPRASVKTPTPVAKPQAKVIAKKPAPPPSSERESWRWPVKGPLTRRFVATGQAHKGIDIKGKMGKPVRASKSGVVVYAGSGLVGYGNLLILKHSERYLSAYGHNRRLLVKEGERVKAGQTIAELGDSGTNSAKLHFEVRIDGKPVDPLKLLPRR